MRVWRRRLAMLGLSTLAAPVLVVAAAQPAHAATGSISEPPAGQTYTTAATLVIKAQVERRINDGGKVTLTLQLPGSTTEYELASHVGGATSGGTYPLQFTYDPGCPQFPGKSCDGRPAPNGTHVIRLRGTSNAVERSFVTRVPPKRPTGVNASATGQRQVTVRWDRGNEPDLAGYDLFTNGDQVVQRGISPDRTEYVVNYPETGYEGDKTFYVVAQRRACAGCSDTLASPRSNTASARLDAPPPPPPSPDPTYEPSPAASPSDGTGSGSGTGTGGSGSGSGSSGTPSPGATSGPNSSGTPRPGSSADPSSNPSASSSGGAGSGSGGKKDSAATPPAAAIITRRQAFALQFKSFAPKIGAPKLPPLPNFEDPEIAEEDGTYEETLDFGEQDIEELVTSAQGGGERSVVEELVTQAFEGRRLWSSIGWSLVLFLIAGHLRRWLNAGVEH
ncbi:MAG TPA: hypothetical protein VNA12_11060 [Mycobacteriales bacterium]|nr:hypothetical protein [Mycobacteriales bacterium]